MVLTVKEKIIGFFLIVLGSFLEVYFYYYKYESESGNVWLSIIKGLALTLLLSSLVMLRKYKRTWIFAVLLLGYSVATTTDGQIESAKSKDKKLAESIIVEEKSYIDKDIKTLEEEKLIWQDTWNTNNTLINNSIKDYRDTIDYGITNPKYEDRRDEALLNINRINTEIRSLNTAKRELKIETTTDKYYDRLMKVAFSIFVALMSPAGIFLLTKNEALIEVKQEPVAPREKTKKEWFKLWAKSLFKGEDKPLILKGRPSVIREIGITNTLFAEFSELAVKKGLIVVDGKLSKPLVDYQEFLNKTLGSGE